MSLLRKLFLASLVFCSIPGVSHASFSRPSISRQALQDYPAVKRELSLRRQVIISYEELKGCIEGNEECSKIVKQKARFAKDYPEVLMRQFTDEELEECQRFWKIFYLDVKRLPVNNDPEYSRLLLDAIIPIFVEMQGDLDRTLGIQFDYENLNKGEEMIIHQHFKYEGRYYSEGGKRKRLFEK